MTTKDNKKKSNNVTIVDVAEMCGVSVKTVSRVVNQDSNVSERTRQKILDAIKKTGYQVNMFARGLKGQKTNIIMIFTDRHGEEHLSNWHTLMLKYLFRYAKENGMKVVMSPSNSTRCVDDDTDGFTLLANGMADGVILLENVHSDPRAVYFREHNIPYVMFGEPDDDETYAVSLDNYQVGYKGGKYLTGCRYRNVAFLVGEEKFLSTQNRIKGFKDSVKGKEGKYKVYTGVNSIQLAYEKAKELLETENPDAFFVSGDERALGVYQAIHENGLRIPEDVAVLGVDNIPIGKYYYPRISTIDQNFEQLAKECIDRLVKLIRGEKIEGGKVIEFQPEVLEREST